MCIVKNNHNYIIQIIHFYLEDVQIIHGVNLHFFKIMYMSVCVCVYIYDLEFNWF